MIKLSVNIDVATLRQARGTTIQSWGLPDCGIGEADAITLHLREDRRHIQDNYYDPARAAKTRMS